MRSGAETFSRITKTLPLLRTLQTAATCDKISQLEMHQTDSKSAFGALFLVRNFVELQPKKKKKKNCGNLRESGRSGSIIAKF
jgi:hypothetical protein